MAQETKNKVGRPARSINYINVIHNDNEYTIGIIDTNEGLIKFLIDKDDFPKIKDLTWHYISKSYICHNVNIEGKQKALYLHNMVMNRLGFPGKGAKESVDHINRIGLDNRKENLRIITQSEQNLNQSKRPRKIELPADSELTVDDIPKHIWYVKANGSHGDRFAIEFKTENIVWKTTSSKKISLKDKLEAAKEKLNELYEKYPYLNPDNKENDRKKQELIDSYHEILKLADN